MADNIVIGAGRLYVAELDADGDPGPERYLGDSVGASLTGGEGDRIQVFAGDGADSSRKLVDKLLDVTRSMSLTLHDISLDNLALFVMGEKTTPSANASAQVDEQFPGCAAGDEFQLGTYKGGADVFAAGFTVPKPTSSAKITGKTGTSGSTAIPEAAVLWAPKQAEPEQNLSDGAGTTVSAVAASHKLRVYGDTGRVEVLADDYATDGFRLSYTPTAEKREYVESATEPLEAAVRYIEYDPRNGVGRNVYMTKATIRPNGEWALKTRGTEQQLPLTCEALGKVYVSEGVSE